MAAFPQIGFTSKTSAASPRSGFDRHFVRPIGPLHLPTDERAIVVFGQRSLMTAPNVRCFTIFATGALCRLAPRDPIDHRLLGLLPRHGAAARLARSRGTVGGRLSRDQRCAWVGPHLLD